MLFFRIYIYNACGCLQQAVRDLKLVFRVYSGRGEFRFQTHTANEFSAVLLLLWAKIVNLYTRTGAPAHDEDNTYSEYQSAMTDGIQMTKEKKKHISFSCIAHWLTVPYVPPTSCSTQPLYWECLFTTNGRKCCN